MCVEGHARAWPRDTEGECGGVAGEGVGRGGVLLQEVSPLLVVVIPEHVERLWKHSCKLYRPIPDDLQCQFTVAEGVHALRAGVLVCVLLEGHLDLVVAVAVGAAQRHRGVPVRGEQRRPGQGGQVIFRVQIKINISVFVCLLDT